MKSAPEDNWLGDVNHLLSMQRTTLWYATASAGRDVLVEWRQIQDMVMDVTAPF
jgi:hypothetical protein